MGAVHFRLDAVHQAVHLVQFCQGGVRLPGKVVQPAFRLRQFVRCGLRFLECLPGGGGGGLGDGGGEPFELEGAGCVAGETDGQSAVRQRQAVLHGLDLQGAYHANVTGEHSFLQPLVGDTKNFIGPAAFREAGTADHQGVRLLSLGNVHFYFLPVCADKDPAGEGYAVQGDFLSRPGIRKQPGHRIRYVFNDGKVLSDSQKVEHGSMLSQFSESGESLKRVWGYPVMSKGGGWSSEQVIVMSD